MSNEFNIKQAYYLFLLIRKSEEKIIELYNTDKIKSPVHLSIGQEAISVGVSLALSESDIIFSNYRGHAHFIAREANLDKMWAELYGKSRGTARGKGGSMHLNDLEKNFYAYIGYRLYSGSSGSWLCFCTLNIRKKRA